MVNILFYNIYSKYFILVWYGDGYDLIVYIVYE